MSELEKKSGIEKVIEYSSELIDIAESKDLMHQYISSRSGKNLRLDSNHDVIDFINCSYLNLDVHPKVIEGAKNALDNYGVHFCCARSRLSISPNKDLESKLSEFFNMCAITFPSVTSAHLSSLPMLSSGVLLEPNLGKSKRTRLIFDKFAHASMKTLKPILEKSSTVVEIPHNSIKDLEKEIESAKSLGEIPVYVADGAYSMGGFCPIKDLSRLSREEDLYLYLDDAHGTSIFGKRGEGYVLENFSGIQDKLFTTFSLAKGFGCNGGGISVPNKETEKLIRYFGVTYAFSAPLDFSIVGAALAALDIHYSDEFNERRTKLNENIAYFNSKLETYCGNDTSPIRMLPIGDEVATIEMAQKLLKQGFLVSAAIFPVVPKGKGQLRVALNSDHNKETLENFSKTFVSLISVN